MGNRHWHLDPDAKRLQRVGLTDDPAKVTCAICIRRMKDNPLPEAIYVHTDPATLEECMVTVWSDGTADIARRNSSHGDRTWWPAVPMQRREVT